MQQPKPFLNRLRLRNHAIGVERRRNISKMILERGTPFPKPIKYEDIDQAFFNWVDKTLDISYMGKRLPTYRLFSTQKLVSIRKRGKTLMKRVILLLILKQ
jgi:hypothetical protein